MKFNLKLALPVIATHLCLPHSAFASRLTGIDNKKEQSNTSNPPGLVVGKGSGEGQHRRVLPSNDEPLPYSIEKRLRRAQKVMDNVNTTSIMDVEDIKTSPGTSWNQLCNHVDDYPYDTVVMAQNGNVFAVGSKFTTVEGRKNAGLVRVYKKDISAVPNCWVQTDELVPTSGSYTYFGTSLAMTEDGSHLVVGGYGVTHVYKAEGPFFALVGELSIPGPEVSISDDAQTIAVGNAKANSDRGEVYMYEYGGQSAGYEFMYQMHGVDKERFGTSLSLSADGNLLVVGSPIWYGKTTAPGIVRVFEKIDAMTWQQRGHDLVGDIADDSFGDRVSMAGSGRRFAVGAKDDSIMGYATGSVRVFDSESLEQIGNTIYGENEGSQAIFCGRDVSLDFDGHRLAAACPTQDNYYQGIRVFDNSDDSPNSLWVQFGDGFGDSGRTVSLARDGKSAAVANRLLNSYQGKAAVYLEPKCTDSPLEAKLKTTDGDDIPFHCRYLGRAQGGFSCNSSGVLASHCPEMCDSCADFGCADSEATFIKGGREKDCSWVKNLNEKKKLKVCSNSQLAKTCRASCGLCGLL